MERKEIAAAVQDERRAVKRLQAYNENLNKELGELKEGMENLRVKAGRIHDGFNKGKLPSEVASAMTVIVTELDFLHQRMKWTERFLASVNN